MPSTESQTQGVAVGAQVFLHGSVVSGLQVLDKVVEEHDLAASALELGVLVEDFSLEGFCYAVCHL